jgi:hypothetical protein
MGKVGFIKSRRTAMKVDLVVRAVELPPQPELIANNKVILHLTGDFGFGTDGAFTVAWEGDPPKLGTHMSFELAEVLA